MALVFGMLLGVGLLLGILICYSRYYSCPPTPDTILGPFVWSEAPESSPNDPPILHCAHTFTLHSGENLARAHRAPEVALGP